MEDWQSRTRLLLGNEGLEKLRAATVAVFGIGGVGGYAVEALARSGVGKLTLVDSDRVALSNLNRQLIATLQTVGQYKVDAMRERLLQINPALQIEARKCFYLPETADEFDFTQYDYIIDAVDTLTAKLAIVQRAQTCGVRVISCMGAGNKLDPTRLKVADIYETSVCPLARVMRRECRKRGIRRLKVVYSTEDAIAPAEAASDAVPGKDASGVRPSAPRRATPGSIAFVPAVAGMLLASEVVHDLLSPL